MTPRALRALAVLTAVVTAASATVAAAPATAAPATAAPARRAAAIHVARVPVSLKVHGQRATGLVYTPYRHQVGDLRSHALVVFCHGHGDTATTEASYLTALARTSRVPVLAMNNRGKPGAWNVTTGEQDTLAATRAYLRTHHGIRTRVLWGWSMGGLTSALSLAHSRGVFDYWVASFPAINDLAAYYFYSLVDPSGAKQIEADAGGCTPVACPAPYLKRTASLLASRLRYLKRAVLLQGVGDTTSPYEQSQEMHIALLAAGIPVSNYTMLTSRSPSGGIRLDGHGAGPVADEALAVVERILAGTEPLQGRDREYVVDGTTGWSLGAAS